MELEARAKSKDSSVRCSSVNCWAARSSLNVLIQQCGTRGHKELSVWNAASSWILWLGGKHSTCRCIHNCLTEAACNTVEMYYIVHGKIQGASSQ